MKKRMKGLFACALALLLAACGADSSPEAVAEQYVKNIYAGDVDAVMKIVHIPQDKQATGTEDVLRGKLAALAARRKTEAEAAGGIKSISAAPAEYGDDKTRARVTVSVSFKKSEQTEQVRVRLIDDDGKWKIFL